MSEAQIDLRVDEDVMETMDRAAGMMGMNLSSFIVASAMDKARQVITEHDWLTLSNRDRDVLLHALDNPPAPNKILRQAAERFVQQGFA